MELKVGRFSVASSTRLSSCHLFSHFLITQESCGGSGQKGNDQNHPLWASFWIWRLNQQTGTMRELFLELGPINVNFQRCLPSLFSFPHPCSSALTTPTLEFCHRSWYFCVCGSKQGQIFPNNPNGSWNTSSSVLLSCQDGKQHDINLPESRTPRRDRKGICGAFRHTQWVLIRQFDPARVLWV